MATDGSVIAALASEQLDEIIALQRKIYEEIEAQIRAPQNLNDEIDDSLTFGQRLADKVAAFGGSWTFIGIFAIVLVVWVIVNSIILAGTPDVFDPYPYILLNLFLSIIAAIQGPIIMMSQNRQAARDRLKADNDYQYEVQTQLNLANLNKKADELRWAQLIEMQNSQIEALTRLLDRG